MPYFTKANAMNRQKLHDKIHCILRHDWDPIGVGAEPGCENEYARYVGGMCRLIQGGADRSKIKAQLVRLQIDTMGLSRVSERTDAAAAKLVLLSAS